MQAGRLPASVGGGWWGAGGGIGQASSRIKVALFCFGRKKIAGISAVRNPETENDMSKNKQITKLLVGALSQPLDGVNTETRQIVIFCSSSQFLIFKL